MKKFIAVPVIVPVIAAAVLVPSLAATPAHADTLTPTQVTQLAQTTTDVAATATQVVAAAQAGQAGQALDLIDAQIGKLQVAQTYGDGEYGAEVVDLLKTAFELRGMITSLATGTVPSFDLTSVGPRLELLVTLADTIHTATTTLQNKVQPAHVELGLECTKAVLRIVNISNDSATLQATTAELKAVLSRVSTYRDLAPSDTATIYTMARLDKAILDTRWKRDTTVLGKAPFASYVALNSEITKAVGVRGAVWSTVGQVDAQIAALDAAYAKALASVPAVR